MTPLGDCMEKRLFLAVFLSLVVAFGFQAMFGQKPTKSVNDLSQTIDKNSITRNSEMVSSESENTLSIPAHEGKAKDEV